MREKLAALLDGSAPGLTPVVLKELSLGDAAPTVWSIASSRPRGDSYALDGLVRFGGGGATASVDVTVAGAMNGGAAGLAERRRPCAPSMVDPSRHVPSS